MTSTKRRLIEALQKADKCKHESELQHLRRKVKIVIQHFPDNWRDVVNEDAALYYTFEEFRKLAAKEGECCSFINKYL